MSARGAILLEVILSVALFTMGALAILAQMSQGARAMEATQRMRQAADLAATTMARIEAGLASPESLTGPAERWDAEQQASLEDALDPAATPGGRRGDPIPSGRGGYPGETGWELAVVTEPSPFDGLTLVMVTASFSDPVRPGAPGASYTLHQLVRLGAAPEDSIGREDALMRELERGARQQRPAIAPAGDPAGRPGGAP